MTRARRPVMPADPRGHELAVAHQPAACLGNLAQRLRSVLGVAQVDEGVAPERTRPEAATRSKPSSCVQTTSGDMRSISSGSRSKKSEKMLYRVAAMQRSASFRRPRWWLTFSCFLVLDVRRRPGPTAELPRTDCAAPVSRSPAPASTAGSAPSAPRHRGRTGRVGARWRRGFSMEDLVGRANSRTRILMDLPQSELEAGGSAFESGE